MQEIEVVFVENRSVWMCGYGWLYSHCMRWETEREVYEIAAIVRHSGGEYALSLGVLLGMRDEKKVK